MTSLERVLTTLRFEEPDRVPYFEQGVASTVASDILGREAHTGGGGLRRDGVEAAMAGPAAMANMIATTTPSSMVFWMFTCMGLLLCAFRGGMGICGRHRRREGSDHRAIGARPL